MVRRKVPFLFFLWLATMGAILAVANLRNWRITYISLLFMADVQVKMLIISYCIVKGLLNCGLWFLADLEYNGDTRTAKDAFQS